MLLVCNDVLVFTLTVLRVVVFVGGGVVPKPPRLVRDGVGCCAETSAVGAGWCRTYASM